MAQDSFIHEATRANINTPQGENATLFANSAVARNADVVGARHQLKHADGTFEPLTGSGDINFNYSVDIEGVAGPGNTSMTLTATPSVGAVADYTYAFSLHSNNIAGTSVNPTLGAPVLNVITVSNAQVSEAEGMIKVLTTHIATGTIAENYFWLTLEGNIG